MCTTRKLLTIKGFTEEKVAKIRETCLKLYQQVNSTCCFVTALEVCDQRRQVFKLTTGSANIE